MATWARGVFDKPTILVPGTPHGRTTHAIYYGRPAAGWRPLRHAAKSRHPTQQTLTCLRRNTSNVSWEHTEQRTSHPNLSRQTTAATRPLRPQSRVASRHLHLHHLGHQKWGANWPHTTNACQLSVPSSNPPSAETPNSRSRPPRSRRRWPCWPQLTPGDTRDRLGFGRGPRWPLRLLACSWMTG